MTENLAEEIESLRWCNYHHLGTKIVDFPQAENCYSSPQDCIAERDLYMEPDVLAAILDTRPMVHLLIGRRETPDYLLVVRLCYEEGSSVGYVSRDRVSNGDWQPLDGEFDECKMPSGEDSRAILQREIDKADVLWRHAERDEELQNRMTPGDYDRLMQENG